MSAIHPQLASDCVVLGRFPLCHLLLTNDCHYPWFILVPARADIREIYQLEVGDRRQLLDESCQLSEFLMEAYSGDKLNVAALGNQVPQLHLHHIVRYAADPAWPARRACPRPAPARPDLPRSARYGAGAVAAPGYRARPR